MKETFLTRKDDNVGDGLFDSIKWALESHVGIADDSRFNSAMLYGNEDAPERIDFYTQAMPLITDKVAWRWPVPEDAPDSLEDKLSRSHPEMVMTKLHGHGR